VDQPADSTTISSSLYLKLMDPQFCTTALGGERLFIAPTGRFMEDSATTGTIDWETFWCSASTMLPGLWLARPWIDGDGEITRVSSEDGSWCDPLSTDAEGFDFVLIGTAPFVPADATDGSFTQPSDPDPVVLSDGKRCRVSHGQVGAEGTPAASLLAVVYTGDLDDLDTL